ncbi:putative F-box domain-containing protein, partial [Tanacetum coccineum]
MRNRDMGVVMFDVVEEILLRLDVEDLLRCKSVCKLWYSLISSDCFVQSHLNRTHKKNHGHRRRRIFLLNDCSNFCCRIIGSSNGLICISPYAAQFLVTNPSTREVKNLPTLDGVVQKNRWKLCWGFGYDFSIDDYKLVVGIRIGDHRTCFHVLTLKSNVWRLVGDVNYNTNNIASKIIISFDLSQEEFQEIPLPDDTRYVRQFFSWLGIIEECLCIFTSDYNPTWVMESYNVKQSWKMLPVFPNMKYDLRRPLNCISPYTSWSLCDDKDDKSFFGWLYLGAPIFVKSLLVRCVKSCEEKKITEKKEIFGLPDIERKVLTVGILILRPGSPFSYLG